VLLPPALCEAHAPVFSSVGAILRFFALLQLNATPMGVIVATVESPCQMSPPLLQAAGVGCVAQKVEDFAEFLPNF